MHVYTTKGFARFARRQKIDDAALCEAITRAERGLIDADLGGGVIKQRVARPGAGRSGGFRTLLAYRTTTRAVFVDGFAKNDQDNIADTDLEKLRELAAEFLGHSIEQVRVLVEAGAWMEVTCND